MFTPGIDFILRTLTRFGLPPILLSVVARALVREYGDYTIPTWVLISASLLSMPLIPITGIVGTRWYNRYHAWKLGARVAPEVRGKRIGNFDVLQMLEDSIQNDYLGAHWLPLVLRLG
jgi:hypothetical protein